MLFFRGVRTQGLISVCTFEALAAEGMIDPKAFRPAAVLKRTPGACLSSTPLYPDWTLGYMAWADGDQVRRVAAVAFSLPENDGWRWGLRVDLSSVRSLMEALHFGPYSYLDEQTVVGFMKSHAEWFAALVAVVSLRTFPCASIPLSGSREDSSSAHCAGRERADGK